MLRVALLIVTYLSMSCNSIYYDITNRRGQASKTAGAQTEDSNDKDDDSKADTENTDDTCKLTVLNLALSTSMNSELNSTLTGKKCTIEKSENFKIINQPKSGSITFLDPSSGAFTYVPNKDYIGNDSFQFVLMHEAESSDIGHIDIKISSSLKNSLLVTGPEESTVGKCTKINVKRLGDVIHLDDVFDFAIAPAGISYIDDNCMTKLPEDKVKLDKKVESLDFYVKRAEVGKVAILANDPSGVYEQGSAIVNFLAGDIASINLVGPSASGQIFIMKDTCVGPFTISAKDQYGMPTYVKGKLRTGYSSILLNTIKNDFISYSDANCASPHDKVKDAQFANNFSYYKTFDTDAMSQTFYLKVDSVFSQNFMVIYQKDDGSKINSNAITVLINNK